MEKIVNLANSFGNTSSNMKLSEWLQGYYVKNDLALLFANMDSAMKYVHSKGYCIYSFNPSDIEILNGSLEQIRFNVLMELPGDFSEQKDIVRDNIWKSSFLQIAIYSKCLDCLKPDFLKENFDGFATFLPEDMVPYYRGIIVRNASVYLGDYLLEKRRRDLEALEKEISNTDSGNSLKNNAPGNLLDYDSMNSKVNSAIYKKLNGISDTAFVSFLMMPILVIVLGVVLVAVVFLMRSL